MSFWGVRIGITGDDTVDEVLYENRADEVRSGECADEDVPSGEHAEEVPYGERADDEVSISDKNVLQSSDISSQLKIS